MKIKTFPFRHICGEIIIAEIFFAPTGQLIPAFFPETDRDAVGLNIYKCPRCKKNLDLDFCENPYLVEPMPENMADATMRRKFCSICWDCDFEKIIATDDTGEIIGFYVLCKNCKEDTIGYVSEQFILGKRANDRVYFHRDVKTISEALEIPLHADYIERSEKDTVKSLGF